MTYEVLKEVLAHNQGFEIRTAEGGFYRIPHIDFVAFNSDRSCLVFFDQGKVRYFPLNSITEAMTLDPELQAETS